MHIKTIIYHYIPTRMAKLKRLTKPVAREGVAQLKLSCIADGNEKLYSHFGKQFVTFLKS